MKKRGLPFERSSFGMGLGMGLFFVDDFNHLAVGFETEVFAFGFFTPEEETFFAGDVDFVGHLAFEVEDVERGDGVFGEFVGHSVDNGVGVVLGVDVVAGFGAAG